MRYPYHHPRRSGSFGVRWSSPEDPVHVGVVELLEAACVAGWVWWHTPNEGKRSFAQQRRMKALGMKSGVVDLLFVGPSGVLHALEIKGVSVDNRKGRLSASQKEWLESLSPACPRAVAWSVDEAAAILAGWGVVRLSSPDKSHSRTDKGKAGESAS